MSLLKIALGLLAMTTMVSAEPIPLNRRLFRRELQTSLCDGALPQSIPDPTESCMKYKDASSVCVFACSEEANNQLEMSGFSEEGGDKRGTLQMLQEPGIWKWIQFDTSFFSNTNFYLMSAFKDMSFSSTMYTNGTYFEVPRKMWESRNLQPDNRGIVKVKASMGFEVPLTPCDKEDFCFSLKSTNASVTLDAEISYMNNKNEKTSFNHSVTPRMSWLALPNYNDHNVTMLVNGDKNSIEFGDTVFDRGTHGFSVVTVEEIVTVPSQDPNESSSSTKTTSDGSETKITKRSSQSESINKHFITVK